jgi:hypothetical protein
MWELSHHRRFTSRYAYVIRGGVMYCLNLGELSVGSGHWIDTISGDGSVIKLEDGSIWLVSPLDVATTGIWLELTDITVTHSGEPGYPYRLIDTDDHETASARFLRSG